MNDEVRKELAKYIEDQNNIIDKARAKGFDKCKMVEVKPSMRELLTYYYQEMIGYAVVDGVISFNKLTFTKTKSYDLI